MLAAVFKMAMPSLPDNDYIVVTIKFQLSIRNIIYILPGFYFSFLLLRKQLADPRILHYNFHYHRGEEKDYC